MRSSIHPHPNQQQILLVAQQLMREAGWTIRKGPGIHVDRGVISVSLVDEPDPDVAAQVGAALEEKTGYRLIVSCSMLRQMSLKSLSNVTFCGDMNSYITYPLLCRILKQ